MGLPLSTMKWNYRSAQVVVGLVSSPRPPEEAGPRRGLVGKQIALLGYGKCTGLCSMQRKNVLSEQTSGPGFFAPVLRCCMETAPTASSEPRGKAKLRGVLHCSPGGGIGPPHPNNCGGPWQPVKGAYLFPTDVLDRRAP